MPLDLSSPFEINVSQAVLAVETNDGRFEHFCRDVVSQIEGGAIIFSTSLSWDLGRDGVGAGVARGIYVMVSLRDDVDEKALQDLARITKTTGVIERVYFCSSHRLSEHRISKLEEQLADESDHKFPITVLGASQLTEAAARDSEIVSRHYAAEIQAALRAVTADPSDEAEIRGLRLALIAAAGENSGEIRVQLYSGGILDILSDGSQKTISGCAKAISERLHISYIISDSAIRPHLERMVVEGFVQQKGHTFSLTERGQDRFAEVQAQAAERFLAGRLQVRKAIEEAIGDALIEDDFQRIWAIFEERIAQHFHARGEAMVAEVSAIIGAPQGTTSTPQSQPSFLEELATAVANTATHPQRRVELHQAVVDLFMDRTSVATDWLVKVSASFVACCALGLEQSSGVAVKRLFGRTTLVLDTDVVLSLLGEGEPEHEAVFNIASKWAKLGGKVLVAEPVLEEVAYHAFIAQHDFEDVRHLIPGTSEDRLHIIENVFVRSFAEHVAKNSAKLGHWNRFISQYRGIFPFDWKQVISLLRAEYSIQQLPPRTTSFENLEQKVRAFLIHTAEERGYVGKTIRDKASRDARLYSQMVNYLESIRATDPGATCLLVSSAHRLAEAEEKFHESGEQQIVVSISTVLHLLSMLPQVSLGLSAMKAFLFEERRPGFSSELERTILRIVRSSDEVAMPWAKRGVLMREVRDRLISDARQQGRNFPADANTRGLEREALSDANKPRTVALMKEALDKVVVSTRTERENTQLRKENEVLRAELDRMKHQNRHKDRHRRG